MQVCGEPGAPCDDVCGGGGCSRCGGPSCGDGAVTKADNALQLSRQASELLTNKERTATGLLAEVTVIIGSEM